MSDAQFRWEYRMRLAEKRRKLNAELKAAGIVIPDDPEERKKFYEANRKALQEARRAYRIDRVFDEHGL